MKLPGEVVIAVEGVSKKFCRNLKRSMAYGLMDVSRAMIGVSTQNNTLRPGEFWALDDVSFEIKRGDKIGFLGTNGSGKSTLLRLINGIFLPDQGKITVRGKIGALISVGVGFHPHLTGRENIYLNATILGMRKEEIQRNFDSIIDFAEVGPFIDAPVNTYSSGMFVRLGFAIAIHAEPDIMLVDEVLSVGDLAFGMKCQKKLSEYRRNGGTFVFVSHNMQAIRNTCDKVIWLNSGKVIKSGNVHEVCDEYESFCLRKDQKASTDSAPGILDCQSGIFFDNVEFLASSGNPTREYRIGDDLRVRLKIRAPREIKDPIFSIGIHNLEGMALIEHYSSLQRRKLGRLGGTDSVEFVLPKIFFRPGQYVCSLGLAEEELMNKLVWHEKSHGFLVVGDAPNVNQGLCWADAEWKQVERC